MILFWNPIIKPLLDILKPLSILRIGSETGEITLKILDYCRTNSAVLHAIDPLPELDLEELDPQFKNHYRLHRELSLNVLPQIENIDLALIDVDYNLYTLYDELIIIEKNNLKTNHSFPLIILQDINWSNSSVAANNIQQKTPDYNLDTDRKSVFLSAVEEYISDSKHNLDFLRLPAFNGLGMLFERELLKNSTFKQCLDSLVLTTQYWKIDGEARGKPHLSTNGISQNLFRNLDSSTNGQQVLAYNAKRKVGSLGHEKELNDEDYTSQQVINREEIIMLENYLQIIEQEKNKDVLAIKTPTEEFISLKNKYIQLKGKRHQDQERFQSFMQQEEEIAKKLEFSLQESWAYAGELEAENALLIKKLRKETEKLKEITVNKLKEKDNYYKTMTKRMAINKDLKAALSVSLDQIKALEEIITLGERNYRMADPSYRQSIIPLEKTDINELTDYISNVRPITPYLPKPKTAMYIVYIALPFDTTGYTVRSQGILQALQHTDWNVHCLMRPGYPVDNEELFQEAYLVSNNIGPVCYLQVEGPNLKEYSFKNYVIKAASVIENVARLKKPAIIHGASNYENALPALIAARRLGIPFIYEVRGLWEYSEAARRTNWEQTELFTIQSNLETLTAKNADHVLTITDSLKSELINRGVASEIISIAPNSVEPDDFMPRDKDLVLADRLGLNPKDFTLAYVGTLNVYEGLDDLLNAVAQLNKNNLTVHAIIAGKGPALSDLKELAGKLKILPQVHFIENVAPAEAANYWALADAAVLPRKNLKVCQLASPLKPVQAMALGKPVIASDLPALREIVTHEETGLLFTAGDVVMLADNITRLKKDPFFCKQLGLAARKYILEERTTSILAQEICSVYNKLV